MREIDAVLVIVLCASFISTVVAAQAVPAVVSVSPSTVNTAQGQIFTVNITVDPRGNEIYGAQYDLYFDTSVLKAVTQTPGTFLSQDGAATNVFVNETNNTIGKVEYGESRRGVQNGVTSPGVLASVSFEVIGVSGQSDLKLSDLKLSDNMGKRITAEAENGECIIGEVTGKTAVKDIVVEEAHEMMITNPGEIILLDVRTEEEYENEHIYVNGVNLKHIPLSELEDRLDELDKTKKVIVYCKTGMRSRRASEILTKHGFVDVYNMLGGIEAWRIVFRNDIVKATTPMPTPSASVTTPIPSAAITPTPTPRIGGFEVAFATITLIVSYVLKRRRVRNE